MKKAAVVFAAVLTATGVAAVAGSNQAEAMEEPVSADVQEEDTEEEKKNPDVPKIDTSANIHAGTRIAVVSKSKEGRYWELVREGMESAVKDVNEAFEFSKEDAISMTFEGADDERDVETQINTLDAVLAENPDVLCLSASDMNSCQAQLETAQENGIPVVAFDSGVNDEELLCSYLGTDNVTIGKVAAEKLADALDGEGKIAVFSIQEKTQSIQERIEGFTDVLEDYPGMEIVEMVYQDQVTDMAEAMKGALTLHPDLAGVFCTNADIADMYLDLEKGEDSPSPVFVGVDATERQQDAVRGGEELGIASQNPYAIGYRTIWNAILAASPETKDQVEKDVILKPVWIDGTNLENPAYSSYIY